jgi:2'-5' RNA ligase
MLQQHKKTIASPRGDFSDWHRGRKEFALWMIRLEHNAVFRKVEAARKHLSGLLLTPYKRQPHITLFVCGFLTDERRFADDYARHQFDAHCRLIADSGIPPFPIEIGGLNSFASAPFLQVNDLDGGIERLRALLSKTVIEIERGGFTPHVTVGLYAGAFESEAVLERIRTFADDPIWLSVDRITFAAYDSSDISGPLEYKNLILLS